MVLAFYGDKWREKPGNETISSGCLECKDLLILFEGLLSCHNRLSSLKLKVQLRQLHGLQTAKEVFFFLCNRQMENRKLFFCGFFLMFFPTRFLLSLFPFFLFLSFSVSLLCFSFFGVLRLGPLLGSRDCPLIGVGEGWWRTRDESQGENGNIPGENFCPLWVVRARNYF